ncbi:MAG: transposase family protein [Chloroflexota bacterium]|nr:transposase family protein [Chloroflexota bacterium]
MDLQVPPLAPILADLPDCRHARGLRHPLAALLTAAAVAVLCGCSAQSAIADWVADCDSATRAWA